MTLNELLTDPEIIEALQELVSERRKRKAGKLPDVGSPVDVDRNSNRGPMSAERVTAGGLLEPNEDDRQPSLTAESYYATTGGLMTPDRVPTVPEKLRALFFEKPRTHRNITEDQRQYRQTVGDLLTPAED